MWWNRRNHGLGRVFAERPRSIVVDSAEHVARLLAYIHNNPVRAGVVADPADSTWTSHRYYGGLATPPPWLDVEWALAAAGFSSSPAGQSAFHDYVVSRSALPRDPILAGRGPVGPDTIERLVIAVAQHAGLAPQRLRNVTRDREAAAARHVLLAVAQTTFGISGQEIAASLGITPSTVSKIRKGLSPVGPEATRQVVDLYLQQAAAT